MEPELTEEDLEVAEASVEFAIENCPVEGLLSHEDGTPITLDELQNLMERLKDKEKASGLELGPDFATTLWTVISYTGGNCPVEGVATFHDGRRISGRNIMALEEKLRGKSQE
jgi:hypothetical protein